MDESDILKKFGLEYKVPPVKSAAFALSLIESCQAMMIEDILTNDKLSEEEKLQASCDVFGNVIILLDSHE